MKLLFLSPCIPDSNGTGWQQRAFLFLKSYSELFEITFICCNFSGQKVTVEQRDSLNLLCRQVFVFESGNVVLKKSLSKNLLRFFSDKPFFVSASFDSTFLKTLLKSADEADLIHASRLELFSLVPSSYYSQKMILDLDECHVTLFKRKKNYYFSSDFKGKLEKTIRSFDNLRVQYYQANAVKKAKVTCVSSEVEKSRIGNSARIVIVPNVAKCLPAIPKIENSFPKRLLFVGNLSAPTNIDAVMFFAEEIFPKILAHDPHCVFHIVGRQPSLEIIALTKYDKIKLTVDLRNIEQAYLDATVGIVPMRFGTGTKLKLLEAFGFGIPCVSTSLGCEGLSVSNQEHLLIADTPDEFAVACIQLLENLDLQRRIADSAWRYVDQFHRPENVKTTIFNKLLGVAEN
jgi:glycosyltransferase involved in cell wall biosynthesis